jgi:hypothetical protein
LKLFTKREPTLLPPSSFLLKDVFLPLSTIKLPLQVHSNSNNYQPSRIQT